MTPSQHAQRILIAAAIATAIASPSIAQTLNGEPCPQCVARPAPIPFVRPVLGWNPKWSVKTAPQPTHVIRSETVIQSSYGTTVINGVYRSYSR